MPTPSKASRRRAAEKSTHFSQVCGACAVVIEKARDRRNLGRLGLRIDASIDTLGRMLDDYSSGCWTMLRVLKLAEFEEREYNTSQIRQALQSGEVAALGVSLDKDADRALINVLTLSRTIAEVRPNGVDRTEARALVAVLPEAIEAAAVLLRGAKAKLRGGA